MLTSLRAVLVRCKAWLCTVVKSVLLVAALGTLAACAHAFEVAPGYSIKEIPYAGSPFYWIDNVSVLFNGNHRTSAEDSVSGSTWGPPALYKWNTRTGQITELMKTGRYAHLCYDRGYLYISFDRNGDRVVRRGAIDAQVETVVKKEAKRLPFPGTFNRYSCRWEELPEATQSDRGVVTVLRDDHGFIEAERPWDPFPDRQYFLVRPNRAPIPIAFHGAGGGPPFSAFRDAYVFQNFPSVIRVDSKGRINLVHLDGRVGDLQIPPGKWMRGYVRAMPIRDGVFMTSLAGRVHAEGGYIVSEGKAQRILKAMIGDFSVSPDGCAVALVGRAVENSVARIALLRVCASRQ